MAKVMISLPDELLEELDAAAKKRAVSRSRLLAIAAQRELERLAPEEFDAIIERGRASFREAGPFESADLIRAERDSLDRRDRLR